MSITSYTEQLESVQAAIAAIEGGAQSYAIGKQQLTRGDLAVLYRREERLRVMVAREAAGVSAGIRVRGAIPCE